jgi:clan AA aspartic protease (TIGR02281 family)
MKIKLSIPIVVEKVRVQGPGAARYIDMILDTGARFSSLSWETLKDIGYDPASTEDRVKIVTANGVIEAPIIKVKQLCVEKMCVENSEVIALAIPELAEVDGLLGLSFLCNFKTIIDYKKNILEIL